MVKWKLPLLYFLQHKILNKGKNSPKNLDYKICQKNLNFFCYRKTQTNFLVKNITQTIKYWQIHTKDLKKKKSSFTLKKKLNYICLKRKKFLITLYVFAFLDIIIEKWYECLIFNSFFIYFYLSFLNFRKPNRFSICFFSLLIILYVFLNIEMIECFTSYLHILVFFIIII